MHPISECRKASLSLRIVVDTDQHADAADALSLLRERSVKLCPLWVKSRQRQVSVMSALPPKADILRRHQDVRFVPIADIAPAWLKTIKMTEMEAACSLRSLLDEPQAAGSL